MVVGGLVVVVAGRVVVVVGAVVVVGRAVVDVVAGRVVVVVVVDDVGGCDGEPQPTTSATRATATRIGARRGAPPTDERILEDMPFLDSGPRGQDVPGFPSRSPDPLTGRALSPAPAP
jgi:hypothetical protein